MSARVLVVDDVPANVRLMEARLSAEYFTVIRANSGEEALQRVADADPDIVLLDVMMPGMDGFETCRRIKADPRTMLLPVVMVTALSDVADRVRGLEAGADDFLTKPVDDVSLIARVKSLVRLKLMMDELKLRRETSEQLGVAAPVPTMQAETATGAEVLVVDDSQASAPRIGKTLESDGHRIVYAASPDEALRAVGECAFALVLVSLQLGTGDPVRLCSELRNTEASRRVPILIMVDEGDRPRLLKCLDLGIDDYLVRPVDKNELLARSRTQIRRKRYQDRLRQSYAMSVSLALIDGLTGVYNRRYLDSHLAQFMTKDAGAGKPSSVLMLDIDHFKSVNDRFGHPVGDEVLKEVARRIRDRLRPSDTIARYGGEEFVVVMPEESTPIAGQVAERLRILIAERPVACAAGEVPVTISIGVARQRPGDTPGALIERADRALYEAKNGGRNRVVQAPDDEPRKLAVG